MANIIKIKRGLSSNLDKANLQDGEIAFATDTKKLYISNVLEPINTNTTYKISKSGSTITLTGSDGSTTVVQDSDTTYATATQSSKGLMAAADKTKLDGIATGAQVNQNAFSNIIIGSTTIAADTVTDSLILEAGSNITITPDSDNDKITIDADLSQYYTKEEIDDKTNTINQSITAAVSDINILNTWVNTQFDPDVRDIIDAEVSQDIANLTTTVNNLSNQIVSGSKYVYEDSNGNVIIAKDGYLGKFVVHSDRTSLYVGEAELAYVKDGKLYTNQIKTNGLQIGSWLYELTEDGTLNEKWVGGE